MLFVAAESVGHAPSVYSLMVGNHSTVSSFLVAAAVPGEAKGGDNEQKAERTGLGLHFVKLRPEPVTGDNIRSLVQVHRVMGTAIDNFVLAITESKISVWAQARSVLWGGFSTTRTRFQDASFRDW